MPKKKYPGHLLVANPNNPHDELYKGVILVVSHTDQRAIGLQINNPIENLNLQKIAAKLDLDYYSDDKLYFGGSVGSSKIHVIHSLDWQGFSTIKLNDQIAVTNDLSVIAAIVQGDGPEHFRACAGYWSWADGTLDRQLDPHKPNESHKWEIVSATAENIFSLDGIDQWYNAIDESTKQSIQSWF